MMVCREAYPDVAWSDGPRVWLDDFRERIVRARTRLSEAYFGPPKVQAKSVGDGECGR